MAIVEIHATQLNPLELTLIAHQILPVHQDQPRKSALAAEEIR